MVNTLINWRILMKRLFMQLLIINFLCISSPLDAFADDEFRIWSEFVNLLREDRFTEDMIRPHLEPLRKPIMDVLTNMIGEVDLDNIDSRPEVIRADDHISYLVPLSFDDSEPATYCFTFIEENDKWHLRHIENIFIRLDKLSSLPASEFPDLPDDKKNWQREENYWSKQVRLLNYLTGEKGKEFAFDWFKDGSGYFLTAKTWIPFVTPRIAFILYLCWEQANLRGSEVTLEKLDDSEAVVRIGPQQIKIYMHASHLRQQISFEDYVQLFSTIWEDRADKAGWHLDIIGGGWPITFHFKADSSGIDR
jgi:hypothetical protein